MPRWLVESVQVRGQVDEDFAKLTVELLIVVKGAEPVWAPIRLDGQTFDGSARRRPRPGFATGRTGQWQVKLGGEGEHRIQVELRAPIMRGPGSQVAFARHSGGGFDRRRPRFFPRRIRHHRSGTTKFSGRRTGRRQGSPSDRSSLAAFQAGRELDERCRCRRRNSPC